ncbi:hypothetical protein BDD12DRAFT_529319 [Trichophaea hybrida]|nr:hypothetical protein BDD12DRAFT_529319 [Trichophaea hybrida]
MPEPRGGSKLNASFKRSRQESTSTAATSSGLPERLNLATSVHERLNIIETHACCKTSIQDDEENASNPLALDATYRRIYKFLVGGGPQEFESRSDGMMCLNFKQGGTWGLMLEPLAITEAKRGKADVVGLFPQVVGEAVAVFQETGKNDIWCLTIVGTSLGIASRRRLQRLFEVRMTARTASPSPTWATASSGISPIQKTASRRLGIFCSSSPSPASQLRPSSLVSASPRCRCRQ